MINTIILNSEIEFRNFITKNMYNITKTIIFEDILDEIIFFYAFMSNNTIIATKEKSTNNFSFYVKLYNFIANEYNLDSIADNQTKSLRLIKHN